MAGSLFDFIEQLSTAPLINYLNDDDRLDDFDLSSEPWTKYKLDDVADFSSVNDLFADLDGFFGEKNVLNHDCMWAGHCGGKEHADEPRLSGFIPKPPIINKDPPMLPALAVTTQESLLKPSVKAMGATVIQPNTTVVHSLQTPPDSDDEENKINSAALLRMLSDDSNECDSDFADYLIGEEMEVKKETMEVKQEVLDINEENVDIKEELEDTESETESRGMSCEEYRIRTQWAAENDHSYYKDKNAAMINNNYGLDTPSDSEDEEIDVVSIPDKYMLASRAPLSLPTNPSYKDRHHLQKTMASAMSKNQRGNHGIKTILPVRSTDTPGSSGRRRGVKRGRGSRANSSYKRRRASNVVEAEPTDKRHLHNDMERQRRVDLRIAFDNLKAVVPEVSGTKKIAKVNILLQAAQYCYQLTGTNANNIRQMEQLKKKQVWLRSRVSQLRRDLAARR